MIYFKDAAGAVFAYHSEEEFEEFGQEGLVAMTEEEVEECLNPPAPVKTREQVEAARLKAYAEPTTGSDRMFAEAGRMELMGEPGFEEVRSNAIVRYKEIQAVNPWPAE